MPLSNYNSRCLNLETELTRLVTAERSISSQVELGKLAETILVVAAQHSGAEQALLFLARGRKYEIEAAARLQGSDIRVVSPLTPTKSPGFAKSVVRYVIRTEEHVVLDDASAGHQFSEDSYMRHRSLRSIICLPLIAQRESVGILYLENAASGAFVRVRLLIMELLGWHAAALLENARLRVDLQRQMCARRKAEKEPDRIRSK